MPGFVLAAVPAAPALAAALIALGLVRGERAVAWCSVGAVAIAIASAAIALAGGAPPIGGVVALAIAVISLIVCGFAARSMQGGSVAYAPFFALLCAAIAASLAVAVASDLRFLAAAWVVTGLCTSGLIATARTKTAERWALRHLANERVGDVAWIAILILTWQTYHTFDIAQLAHAATPGAATTAIAIALVVAGAVRSALVPFHTWLPNSMEAPTTVSAFMHAGLVNGAGLLLAKTAFVVVLAPAALTLAAILGGATAALGATITLVRPETKRRLGWSTVAQMGFMVLQCACGAFAAAIVHLVAHGGYKSTAFLGAAGSIDNHKRARRTGSIAQRANTPLIAIAALVPATAGVAIALAAARDTLLDLPAATMIIAVVWAAGTSAARRCAERAFSNAALLVALGAVTASVVAYLLCVTIADRWIGSALPRSTFAVPAAIVTCIALASGLAAAFGIRPRVPDAAYTLALVEGRSIRMEPS